jgi:predicted component of type VI protein secretion system
MDHPTAIFASIQENRDRLVNYLLEDAQKLALCAQKVKGMGKADLAEKMATASGELVKLAQTRSWNPWNRAKEWAGRATGWTSQKTIVQRLQRVLDRIQKTRSIIPQNVSQIPPQFQGRIMNELRTLRQNIQKDLSDLFNMARRSTQARTILAPLMSAFQAFSTAAIGRQVARPQAAQPQAAQPAQTTASSEQVDKKAQVTMQPQATPNAAPPPSPFDPQVFANAVNTLNNLGLAIQQAIDSAGGAEQPFGQVQPGQQPQPAAAPAPVAPGQAPAAPAPAANPAAATAVAPANPAATSNKPVGQRALSAVEQLLKNMPEQDRKQFTVDMNNLLGRYGLYASTDVSMRK